MLKTVSKIYSTIVSAIAVVAIIAVVAMAGLYVAGFHSRTVVSGSMEPVVHVGSMAFINTRSTEFNEGDIVMYQLPNGNEVLHRVVAVDGGSFITKGDANEHADLNPVSIEQIKGTYAFQIPKLGMLDRKTYIIALVSLFLLNVSAWLFDYVAEEQKE